MIRIGHKYAPQAPSLHTCASGGGSPREQEKQFNPRNGIQKILINTHINNREKNTNYNLFNFAFL